MGRRNSRSESPTESLVRKTIYLSQEVVDQIEEMAVLRKISFSAAASGILAEQLNPEVQELHRLAAIKRLERIERRLLHVEHGQMVGVEALNLFISTWLTNTTPVPVSQRAAAQARGQERYERFFNALVGNLKDRSATLLAGVLSVPLLGSDDSEES